MFLSLSKDFSFSHSFLKYLQDKLGVDILPFHRHAARRRHTGVISQLCRVITRSNTGHAELFQALLILPQKKKSLLLMVRCDKMLSTALDFLMFQLPLDGLECCVSL